MHLSGPQTYNPCIRTSTFLEGSHALYDWLKERKKLLNSHIVSKVETYATHKFHASRSLYFPNYPSPSVATFSICQVTTSSRLNFPRDEISLPQLEVASTPSSHIHVTEEVEMISCSDQTMICISVGFLQFMLLTQENCHLNHSHIRLTQSHGLNRYLFNHLLTKHFHRQSGHVGHYRCSKFHHTYGTS